MIQYEEEKEREEEETSDLIQLGNAFGPKVVGMINQRWRTSKWDESYARLVLN